MAEGQTQTTTTTTAPPPPVTDTGTGDKPTTSTAAPTSTAVSTAGGTTSAADKGGATSATTNTTQAAEQSTQAGDFTLKLPDGVKADDPFISKFVPLAKEVGLKADGAQKLIDFIAAQQADGQKARESNREQQTKEWTESLRADKDFGGQAFEQNVAIAQRAFAKFGGPGLQKFLEDTGLGNRPELVRAFHAVGKAIAEDSVGGAHGGPGSGGPMSDAERHAVLFPSMTPNKP